MPCARFFIYQISIVIRLPKLISWCVSACVCVCVCESEPARVTENNCHKFDYLNLRITFLCLIFFSTLHNCIWTDDPCASNFLPNIYFEQNVRQIFLGHCFFSCAIVGGGAILLLFGYCLEIQMLIPFIYWPFPLFKIIKMKKMIHYLFTVIVHHFYI